MASDIWWSVRGLQIITRRLCSLQYLNLLQNVACSSLELKLWYGGPRVHAKGGKQNVLELLRVIPIPDAGPWPLDGLQHLAAAHDQFQVI